MAIAGMLGESVQVNYLSIDWSIGWGKRRWTWMRISVSPVCYSTKSRQSHITCFFCFRVPNRYGDDPQLGNWGKIL